MAIIYTSRTRRTTGSADLARGATALASIDEDISRYWGRLREDFFVCSFTQIREKREASPTGHVALKVRSINNPNRVSAEWVKFNNTARPTAAGTTYFVLDEAEITAIAIDNGDGSRAVSARFAKDSSGNIYVYFHRTQVIFHPRGTGGEGDTAGARIPSHSLSYE